MNPPDVLPPGVAVKAAGGRVYGHLTVSGIEVDPAYISAPGIAGQIAVAVIVHTVVGIRGVAVSVRPAAGVAAQPDPADIFPPGA